MTDTDINHGDVSEASHIWRFNFHITRFTKLPQTGSETVDLSGQSTYLKVPVAVSFYALTNAAKY